MTFHTRADWKGKWLSLTRTQQSGILRFIKMNVVAWVVFSEGFPVNFYGGELFDDSKTRDGSLEPLYNLQKNNDIRVDFYACSMSEVKSMEVRLAEVALTADEAKLLVRFISEILRV